MFAQTNLKKPSSSPFSSFTSFYFQPLQMFYFFLFTFLFSLRYIEFFIFFLIFFIFTFIIINFIL